MATPGEVIDRLSPSPSAKRIKRGILNAVNDKEDGAAVAYSTLQRSSAQHEVQPKLSASDSLINDACAETVIDKFVATSATRESSATQVQRSPEKHLVLRCGGVDGPLAINRKDSGWREVLSDWEHRSFVAHRASVFSKAQLHKWFQLCNDDLPWEQPSAVIPRGACWLVAEGCKCSYNYAAVSFAPAVMPDWFLELTQVVCDACGITDPPNSCNANRYDSGMESVGWHADAEDLFDATNRDALIVSLSLGASRKFELRPNKKGAGGTCAHVILSNGDLCTMEGLCQKHYQHCVPKEFQGAHVRINLTWRWIVSHSVHVCPLAASGLLGDKLRDLAKTKNQLKWKQVKRKRTLEEHNSHDPSSSDEKASNQEQMRSLQEKLGHARARLAELKRNRVSGGEA